MSLNTFMKSAHEHAVFVGSTLAFLMCVSAQRLSLSRYNTYVGTIQTEDDTKVRFSLVHEFMQIARLALPTLWCKEFAGTVTFILLFVVRSFLRVAISKANGAVMRAMIEGAAEERVFNFIRMILLRASVSMMAAVCSGCVEHLRAWLIGCYRVRLARFFQRRFYTQLVYYRATIVDNQLEPMDTVISTYCGEFAEHFAELPYYFLLPILEVITSMVALTKHVGGSAAMIACGSVATSVFLLQKLLPAFGKVHACLLSREDDHRRTLKNGLNSAESIAMYGGNSYMQHKLEVNLSRVKYALDYLALARGHFALLENAFSAVLHTISSIVVLGGLHGVGKMPMNDIYVGLQYMQDLNESVKDFVVNFQEMSHLATFTTKLAEFDTALANIAQGTVARTMGVTSTLSMNLANECDYSRVQSTGHLTDGERFRLLSFSNLKLTTPSGQVLFSNLNLEMESDQDWVIVGENGCGKTSFLRMISGLWPQTEGHYTVDKRVKLLFAPQHSYMVPECTLLEQLMFPQIASSPTEEDIACFQQAIQLSGAQSVVDLLGGLNSPYVGIDPQNISVMYDWSSLSGGQKQRINMARVFYHVLRMDRKRETPLAVLDEATSMMDETEQEVLLNLRKLNVRMLSVTHRDAVISHHTHLLRIMPGGGWITAPLRPHEGTDAESLNIEQ